jgi:DNA excision repair protein ERCC-2
VYFPYDYIYPEQYAYMVSLKRILDARGHGVLEVPSGTGKTIALLSLILAYQQVHPTKSKLIYCSRTVPEIDKALEELKGLVEYRDKMMGKKNGTGFLGIGLSARRHLCINEQVMSGCDGNREFAVTGRAVDARCHSLTASWVRQRAQVHPGENIKLCQFFDVQLWILLFLSIRTGKKGQAAIRYRRVFTQWKT